MKLTGKEFVEKITYYDKVCWPKRNEAGDVPKGDKLYILLHRLFCYGKNRRRLIVGYWYIEPIFETTFG